MKKAASNRQAHAGAVGAAIGVVAVWIIQTAWSVQVPAEVAAAIAGLAGYAVSYFTRPA